MIIIYLPHILKLFLNIIVEVFFTAFRCEPQRFLITEILLFKTHPTLRNAGIDGGKPLFFPPFLETIKI